MSTISFAQLASENDPAGLPEADGVDILIHVGLHKTGTTWLQEELFPKLADICYEPSFRPTHRAFLRQPANEFSLEVVRQEFGDLLVRARDENKPLIISDEALGGRAFQQKYLREVVALRLRAAFPSAKILISVREQRALLGSLYGEYLRCGFSSTLERFLTQQTVNPNIEPPVDFSFYEYDRTQAFYEDMFGQNRVAAVPMEWTIADPSGLLAKINTLLGRNLQLPSTTQTTRQARPALSQWARSAQRFLNGFVPQDSRSMIKHGPFSPNSIGHRIDRLTPSWARQKGRDHQKRMINRLVGNHFAESNARFAQMSGFDLSALGYPTAQSAADPNLAMQERKV